MLVLEKSVTKKHWQGMLSYIERRLKHGKFRRIDRGVVCVLGGSCTTTYVKLVRGRPVAWLYLGRRPAWHAWEVKQVWVYPEYRRSGAATLLYKIAVNHEGLTVASGKTQAKGARALWERFVKNRTFNLYAIDFNDLNQRCVVWYEDEELHSRLELYGKYGSQADVRLVADPR